MITKEQVADLRAGDVVEITISRYPGYTQRGPLTCGGRRLYLGPDLLRTENGDPAIWAQRDGYNLTVISRAPRPLYVNHDRTEPVKNDVIRDGDGNMRFCASGIDGHLTWWTHDIEPGFRWTWTDKVPQPLTLLVDGTSGQAVSS